jgi:cytochrome d ubiquinol oxidase subunit II
VLVGVVATAATVWLVRRRTLRGTRLTALLAVASVVLAWGAAQWPYLLPPTLTIDAGAGDPDTLRWLLIVTGIAVVLVAPALALLYRLDLGDRLAADQDADLSAEHATPEAP